MITCDEVRIEFNRRLSNALMGETVEKRERKIANIIINQLAMENLIIINPILPMLNLQISGSIHPVKITCSFI